MRIDRHEFLRMVSGTAAAMMLRPFRLAAGGPDVFYVALVAGVTVINAITSRTPATGRALLREIRSSFYRKLFLVVVSAAGGGGVAAGAGGWAATAG